MSRRVCIKKAAEQEEMNTPPRVTTPRLRRSPRIVAESLNAPPTQTEEEKLNAFFQKSCNIWEDDRKPPAQSYGDCLICLETMYKGDIMVLGCGHKLHTKCAEKLYRRDNKCPECRCPDAFTILTRAEPPKDILRDLEIKYQRAISRNVALNQKLKRLEKYEKDARFLWGEFVTPEIASSNFIWRNMSKRYLVK